MERTLAPHASAGVARKTKNICEIRLIRAIRVKKDF
jgi:hypothetical protein